MTTKIWGWTALALALAGCGHGGAGGNNAAALADADQAAPVNQAAPAAAATPAAAASPAAFSIDSVPVTNVALGSFPYFSLPDGYQVMNKPVTLDFGHFPFWTGKAFHYVEGKVYQASIEAGDDKTYSSFELKKNIAAELQQAGATQIADGKIPSDLSHGLPDEIAVGMIDGLGDIYNDPTETWVIHRPDRQIWVHFTTNSASGAWTIVESKPFVPTAKLLPASELKKDIDANGKAVIHVNFATDKTTILPDSTSQIDAVTTLLKDNPGLRLAVNGYTDDTGSAAHNQSLSDGRAKAVMAALVAAGISADRLQAKGQGASDPVSSNDSEEGRAANRRVELVKL